MVFTLCRDQVKMKNIGLIIFVIGILISCDPKNSNSTENQHIRKEILKREFNNQEVQSIEIVEIEHPTLGGIVNIVNLDKEQKEKFLSDFDGIRQKGIYKCKSTHVIRIYLESDTLRLKVCGNMISSRTSDMYYGLPNEESMIKEYLEK